MATTFKIIVTENTGGKTTKETTMGLVDFLTKVHSVSFNDPIEVNHDYQASQGQKVKATADKEPFTISLVTPTSKDAKDIEMKLDSLKNNITIKSLDGMKVNGLDEIVFSGSREKASFEYDPVSKLWILW